MQCLSETELAGGFCRVNGTWKIIALAMNAYIVHVVQTHHMHYSL